MENSTARDLEHKELKLGPSWKPLLYWLALVRRLWQEELLLMLLFQY